MTQRIVLSVAMCTYNGAKYLEEQLESIALQTRLPDEIVVCDDCSTDNTLDILENFRKAAPFSIRIYSNEKNLGSTKNFEKAISLCSGGIIVLCDQDDMWMPTKLERLENGLKKNPEAGYIFSNALVVDESLRPMGYTIWDVVSFKTREQKHFQDKKKQSELLLKRNVVTGATMAFRAELRDFILPIPQDWVHDAWIALLLSTMEKKGVFIDETLIKYRQHSGQLIGGRKLSLKDKYKKPFKVSLRKDLNVEVLKLKHLLERVEKFNLKSEQSNLIALKIKHLQNRKAVMKSSSIGAKIRKAIGEMRNKSYFRFSNGIKSMLKDVFLNS